MAKYYVLPALNFATGTPGDAVLARAAYEVASPERVGQRARLLIRLRDERPLLPDEEFDDNEDDCVEEEDE